MGIMPYTTEKNPMFQVVESYMNGPQNRTRSLQALWDLVDGERIADSNPVKSTTLDHGPLNTPPLREKHIEEDWFGRRPDPPPPQDPQQWLDQEQFDPVTKQNTGFWNYWYGDCEGIFRETLIRAFALSLGLARDKLELTNGQRPHEHPERPGQHWPITFLWKCPEPWWEGWIEFQSWGSGPHDGHVTVVISTPAHGVALYDSPVRVPPPNDHPYNAYAEDPIDRKGPTGLWVVSQKKNGTWNPDVFPSAPSPPASWGVPVLGAPVRSEGKVVCVSPAVGDGGAAPYGIPYQP